MYTTLWRKPSDEAHSIARLIDDQVAGGPMSAQQTEATQQIILTVFCANHEEYVQLKRYLQDMEQCFNVADNIERPQDGLNLYTGTLTGTRYLPVGERDDGEYVPNFSAA